MGEPGASSSSGSTERASSSCEHRGLDDLDPEVVAGMTADELKKFIDTGRTGRRNALPDVSQPGIATTSSAGMAEALQSLSVQSGNFSFYSDRIHEFYSMESNHVPLSPSQKTHFLEVFAERKSTVVYYVGLPPPSTCIAYTEFIKDTTYWCDLFPKCLSATTIS
jgi:hypothetical protein